MTVLNVCERPESRGTADEQSIASPQEDKPALVAEEDNREIFWSQDNQPFEPVVVAQPDCHRWREASFG